ncbi:hypothetical protein NL676_035208 [Syzygium grande]|nr:hypothetical protein NL676_035208 [Syzygium grande]
MATLPPPTTRLPPRMTATTAPPRGGSIAPLDTLQVPEPRYSVLEVPVEEGPRLRDGLVVRVRSHELRTQLRGRTEPRVGRGVPGQELLGEAAGLSGSIAAGEVAEGVVACK